MTILIAGSGIGGLTLALSLHQIGVPVRVFESVPELKQLGVGINVLPHAVRELIELGLHDRLDASAVRTCELAYFSKHGKPIWSEPRDRKSTRLNSSHTVISYAVFCLKKKKKK